MDNWNDEYSAVLTFEQDEGIISERYNKDEYNAIISKGLKNIGFIERDYSFMSETDWFEKSSSDEKYYLHRVYHYEDDYLGTPDAIDRSNYICEVAYNDIIDAFVDEEMNNENNSYSLSIYYYDEQLEQDVNNSLYEKIYNDEELDMTAEQERGRS